MNTTDNEILDKLETIINEKLDDRHFYRLQVVAGLNQAGDMCAGTRRLIVKIIPGDSNGDDPKSEAVVWSSSTGFRSNTKSVKPISRSLTDQANLAKKRIEYIRNIGVDEYLKINAMDGEDFDQDLAVLRKIPVIRKPLRRRFLEIMTQATTAPSPLVSPQPHAEPA